MPKPSFESIPNDISEIVQPTKLIASDFDHTLVSGDSYKRDPKTGTLLELNIPQDLQDTANTLPVIITTGRRATEASLQHLTPLWQPDRPVIAENGGVLVYRHSDKLICQTLVSTEVTHNIRELSDMATSNITLPQDQSLVVKDGVTAQLLRARNPRGEFVRHDQENLALNLGQLIAAQALDETIQAVPSGIGVTLQAKNISKTTGLLNYLDEINVQRNDAFVVGLGDAPNDDHLLEADLAIGFHPDVEHMVDYVAPNRARDASQVLRTIQQIF